MPALEIPADDLAPLPAALKTAADRHLQRFLNARAAASADPQAAARATPQLARVFVASPFIAEYAIRAPQEFVTLLASPGLQTTTPPVDYRARYAAALARADDEAAVAAAARAFRNRELVRIAWRDLTGLADLESVLIELSGLADALIAESLAWLDASLAARHGTPQDERGAAVPLLVLAMGKLGGQELNFSSDVDLIFLYRAQGETAGVSRALSNQEYFDRLGKRLIALLNDPTVDGFVYRVDMRLRPFGDSGALTASFAALENYYLLHGRDWERYALIKARAVTGDAADIEALEAITRPFVYRRYLDFGALEALREMKAMINAEMALSDLAGDIKRGPGGIREIEFIGQAFQLSRGGRDPKLRQRSILAVLAACAELGLLSEAEAQALAAAYRFLRITEHRLQEVHDQQTQTLPGDAIEQARLAFAMGFLDWPAFAAALAAHRDAVQQCFAALLMPESTPQSEANAAAGDGARLWHTDVDVDRSGELLALAGFDDAARAQDVLDELKNPRFLARLSSEARNRLDRLMPVLVAECAGRARGAETFARVADIVRAIARRSVYLSLLADNHSALGRLVDLCHASPWIAQHIARAPILLDELLDSRDLFSPPGRAALISQLDEAIATAEHDDLDRIMDVVRNFKHSQVLRVAASDLMEKLPIAEVSNHLSWIAEAILTKALALAWADLVARHGRPLCHPSEGPRTAGFAIIAYGKLGGLELGYGSDLDLIFVHDSTGGEAMTDGPKAVANDVFFTRVAQRVIHLISTRTAGGSAYELDIRLRPSGAAGLLVTSLDAFYEYQHNQAWSWEHQALVRARGITGAPQPLERFEHLRRDILQIHRDPAVLRGEIVEMRERMRREIDRSGATQFDLKQGVGGITDIEFMVQYAVLRWAAQHQALTTYTDNLRLLDFIADLGLYPRADCQALRDAFFAYRAEVHRCALQEVDGLVAASWFVAERRTVAAIWQRLMLN